MEKGKSLMKAVRMGKLQAVLLKEKHPMQLVMGCHLAFCLALNWKGGLKRNLSVIKLLIPSPGHLEPIITGAII